jgi:hypothetical protein
MLEHILNFSLAAAIHIGHHGKVVVIPILGNRSGKIREVLFMDSGLPLRGTPTY